MSWTGLSENQTISFENLNDGVTIGFFIKKQDISDSKRQITKQDALNYVFLDEDTEYITGVSLNQLVIKSGLTPSNQVILQLEDGSFLSFKDDELFYLQQDSKQYEISDKNQNPGVNFDTTVYSVSQSWSEVIRLFTNVSLTNPFDGGNNFYTEKNNPTIQHYVDPDGYVFILEVTPTPTPSNTTTPTLTATPSTTPTLTATPSTTTTLTATPTQTPTQTPTNTTTLTATQTQTPTSTTTLSSTPLASPLPTQTPTTTTTLTATPSTTTTLTATPTQTPTTTTTLTATPSTTTTLTATPTKTPTSTTTLTATPSTTTTLTATPTQTSTQSPCYTFEVKLGTSSDSCYDLCNNVTQTFTVYSLNSSLGNFSQIFPSAEYCNDRNPNGWSGLGYDKVVYDGICYTLGSLGQMTNATVCPSVTPTPSTTTTLTATQTQTPTSTATPSTTTTLTATPSTTTTLTATPSTTTTLTATPSQVCFAYTVAFSLGTNCYSACDEPALDVVYSRTSIGNGTRVYLSQSDCQNETPSIEWSSIPRIVYGGICYTVSSNGDLSNGTVCITPTPTQTPTATTTLTPTQTQTPSTTQVCFTDKAVFYIGNSCAFACDDPPVDDIYTRDTFVTNGTKLYISQNDCLNQTDSPDWVYIDKIVYNGICYDISSTGVLSNGEVCSTPPPTPTNTPTNTVTSTQTPTQTSTQTATQTQTPTNTPTSSPFGLFFSSTTCNTDIRSSSWSGSGGKGIFEVVVDLGTDTGVVSLDFNAYSVPDKFEVYWDGNKVIDTGFRGSSVYDSELVNLGYDPVSGSGSGTETFVKDSATPNTVTIIITAPLSGTGWDARLSCPSIILT